MHSVICPRIYILGAIGAPSYGYNIYIFQGRANWNLSSCFVIQWLLYLMLMGKLGFNVNICFISTPLFGMFHRMSSVPKLFVVWTLNSLDCVLGNDVMLITKSNWLILNFVKKRDSFRKNLFIIVSIKAWKVHNKWLEKLSSLSMSIFSRPNILSNCYLFDLYPLDS